MSTKIGAIVGFGLQGPKFIQAQLSSGDTVDLPLDFLRHIETYPPGTKLVFVERRGRLFRFVQWVGTPEEAVDAVRIGDLKQSEVPFRPLPARGPTAAIGTQLERSGRETFELARDHPRAAWEERYESLTGDLQTAEWREPSIVDRSLTFALALRELTIRDWQEVLEQEPALGPKAKSATDTQFAIWERDQSAQWVRDATRVYNVAASATSLIVLAHLGNMALSSPARAVGDQWIKVGDVISERQAPIVRCAGYVATKQAWLPELGTFGPLPLGGLFRRQSLS